MNISSVELTLKCPKCGKPNKIILRQILKEEQIACVACGFNIKLTLKQKDVKVKIEKVQHLIDDLEQTLTKAGFDFHWTIHREKKEKEKKE